MRIWPSKYLNKLSLSLRIWLKIKCAPSTIKNLFIGCRFMNLCNTNKKQRKQVFFHFKLFSYVDIYITVL